MNGYDGSLMSSINAMKPYHDYFNVGMQGGGTGIVFAIYSAGNLSSAPFAAAAADKYGRRFGMFLGSFLIVIGTIIEATCKRGALGQFMGGRFIIGFGVNISCTSAPTYLVEMAYPSWRGVFGGLYNVVGYYIGAIGEFLALCSRQNLLMRASLYLDYVWDRTPVYQLVVENSHYCTVYPIPNCDDLHLVHARVPEMVICQP